MSRAGAIAGAAAAALVLPAAAAAQTESRVSADVSTTIGYSSNPFSVSGGNASAAVATVDVAPRYQLLTPRSTITVSADANFQQYLSRYGYNDSYSGSLDYQTRASERVTAHIGVNVSSAVLGSYNNYLPLPTGGGGTFVPATTTPDAGTASTGTAAPATASDTSALLPVTSTLLPSPYTDVALFGARNRRRTAQVNGDLGITLSTRDSLNVGGYGQATRYGGLSSSDYEAFGGSLGYQRRLSSKLSVGLRGSGSSFDYHGLNPDSQVYSIQATASAQLNDRWNASGALGVSLVNGDVTRSTRSTSLSGNIDLCRRGPHSGMCLQVARQVTPTGVAGSQYVTSAGLSWTRQLDERQNVSLGANYSKVGSDTRLVVGALPLQTEYAQATAGYYRRLGPRLGLVASVNYRQLFGDRSGRTADYGGQAGLSYRFGDRR